MLSTMQKFIRSESAGSIVLATATLLALAVANSPLSDAYLEGLHQSIGIGAASLSLAHWVNDGLMAVFFFLVGLELKRELLEGELSDLRHAVLPALAALGGMTLPALIYLACAGGDALLRSGWAIPAATDIAFALGVLTLLGRRIPLGLKVFLVSLAIIDDLGAVAIIAMFYSQGLQMTALALAGLCTLALAILNWRGVTHWLPYLLVGLLLWCAVLQSGIHATLAGVLAACFIPLKTADGRSPLRDMEHALHVPVAFFLLPIFAFCNAGIPLAGMTPHSIVEPAPLGIALGLLLGKQLGVFGFAWLAVKAGFARLPAKVSWRHVYGAALLCGIGFTMSLFIADLAFGKADPQTANTARLGILLGSAASAAAGYWVLRQVSRPQPAAQ